MKELNKKTSIIIWTFLSLIFALAYVIVCKKIGIYKNTLYFERIVFVFLIVEFIGLNIIIGIKKLWDYIIKKRYIIALIILALFTVFGISGSSNGAVTSWILENEKNNVILGNVRFINSDEYGIETPFAILQKETGINHFSNINGKTKTDMNISIHSPTLTLITLFRIYNIGYLFLSSRMALSFAWNLKIILTILVTYEFLRILTNENKYLSLCGTILISCSSFVNWWMSVQFIIFGQLAIICIDKFMQSKNKKSKIIWSALFSYSVISYILTLYPAWIISFGYIFLSLAIWVILKNRKVYKFEKIDIICFISIFIICSLFGLYFYLTCNTAIKSIIKSAYPGARIETGGKEGIKYLFSYLYSYLLPFKQNFDVKEVANFLSFYPFPIIIAIIYLYKKENHIEFLLPILLILVFESIFCLSGLPNIISKITFLQMVPVQRCAVSIGLGSIYITLYLFEHVKERIIKQSICAYIVLFFLALLIFIPFPNELNTKKYLYIFAIFECIGGFLLFNLGNKKYEKIFMIFAVVFTIISGLTVNPISIGIKPMLETDFAKFVQKEVTKSPNKIWITEDTGFVVSNYLAGQGAKTLNATQTYPQDEFWKLILGDKAKEYKKIWNRYANINVKIIDDSKEPYVELISNDYILLYLTPSRIKQLDLDYLVSYSNLEEIWINGLSMEKIYENKIDNKTIIEGKEVSGIYIYKFVK